MKSIVVKKTKTEVKKRLEQNYKKSIRVIAPFLIFAILISSFGIIKVNAAKSFLDVPLDAWYFNDLNYITNDSRQILDGFPDGTFMPDGSLTVGQFIKCVINARGIKLALPENDYWAKPYIDKAKELRYVIGLEFIADKYSGLNDPYYFYKQPIKRGEMARIVGRALYDITGEYEYRDEELIGKLIKDYDNIDTRVRPWVVKCYDKGILLGYPDGEFKNKNTLTRAEATSVIRKIIDASKRVVPELPAPDPIDTTLPLPSESLIPLRQGIVVRDDGTMLVDGINFDPVHDLCDHRGMIENHNEMSLDKIEEFVMLFLDSIRFFEKDGSFYCEGYTPNLPEGYMCGYSFQIEYKEILSVGKFEEFCPDATLAGRKLPGQGKPFIFKFYGTKNDIDNIVIPIYVQTYDYGFPGNYIVLYKEDKKTLRKVDTYNEITTVLDYNVEGMFEW